MSLVCIPPEFHAWFHVAHFLEIDCNAESLLDTFWKSCFSNYERSETSHYYDVSAAQ